MTTFECCKLKHFPSSYYICINCFRVFHKSCAMKDKSKFIFTEGFKVKCCQLQSSSEISTIDKSLLEDTISELTESSLLQDQHIVKLKEEHKKFVEEVSIREEELSSFIKDQDILLRKANEESAKLRKELLRFTEKITNNQFTQTSSSLYNSKETQTHNLILHSTSGQTPKQNSQVTYSCEKSLAENKTKRKRILLVAGNNGKELAHYLSSYLDDFVIDSILKPNANNAELLRTAVSISKNLTKRDCIIFWPNIHSTWMVSQLKSKLSHTHFIILTTPYHQHFSIYNERIYHSNVSLYKYVHASEGNLNCLLEVNSISMNHKYGYVGIRIKSIGKKHIATHISQKVRKLMDNGVLSNPDIATSSTVFSTTHSPNARTKPNPNINKGTRERPSIPLTATNEPTKNLYPRLSQEQFMEM